MEEDKAAMRLVFLTDNLRFSGGRKVLLEYARHLHDSGHEVSVLTLKPEGELVHIFPQAKKVPAFNAANIPECELVIASKPEEVFDAWKAKRGKVVHFCQGLELIDLEQRLSGAVVPQRYQGKGFTARLRLFRKKLEWRLKHFQTERIYRLPTNLLAVAAPLRDELTKRFGRPAGLCLNGIHTEHFRPAERFRLPPFTQEHPLRIVSVGPIDVTFKGIPTTLAAIAELKADGAPLRLIRVTPKIISGERETCPMVDEWHEKLPQEKLAALFRSCNAYISNSTEGEGFGLPALEAMASGLVCVLSGIKSYRSFDAVNDYAVFVPEFDAKASVAAIAELLNSSPERWLALRERATKLAESYSFPKACASFEEFLRKVAPPSLA